MAVILVQPYDPSWPSQFEVSAAFAKTALAAVGCAIEHVGSTAIPGMVAKPTIDLAIVTPRGAFAAVKAGLEALGYVHQGDLGISGREAFDLVDAEAKARLPSHHLYVCEDGAHELRKELAFRDFMRQQPEWRERLSRLKQDLCLRHDNDRHAYIAGKSPMVEEITRLAMEGSEQATPSRSGPTGRSDVG